MIEYVLLIIISMIVTVIVCYVVNGKLIDQIKRLEHNLLLEEIQSEHWEKTYKDFREDDKKFREVDKVLTQRGVEFLQEFEYTNIKMREQNERLEKENRELKKEIKTLEELNKKFRRK